MPPGDVRCAALTSQSLQVSWQPPPNTHSNGIIQGYKLNYEPILADAWRGVDEMEVIIDRFFRCVTPCSNLD
jgi:hypothetical protein